MRALEAIAKLLAVVLSIGGAAPARGQSGFDDDRVMLQGFYWESYRHGYPAKFPEYGTNTWYRIVRDNAAAIRSGHFNLVWLPPPSFAGEFSAGYNPQELFNLSNSFGSFAEHRAALKQLLTHGIEPVADVVINHRAGRHQWADFRNPTWGPWAITAEDECFSNPQSELFDTPSDQRGASEEKPVEYVQHGGTSYQYPSFRDLDHTNPAVRRDILKYLLQLKSIGYRGWRYDMVHGFHAKWVALYNRATNPSFSVGEYDWDKHANQRGWIWHTAIDPAKQGESRLRETSSVFDFTTLFTLKSNKGRYAAWYGYGNGIGMVGDSTDGFAWKNRAVTFLENHDTGYRTHEDGSPEKDHEFDSFANTWEVEQAYAHILTHPGVPCVYWKHYFDWGDDLRNKIRALLNARKVAGVRSGSQLHTQNNALATGVYAAMVQGSNGQLYVRVGGSDTDWQPFFSEYHAYREYARGAGWKVWVKIPGNPPVQQAPPKPPLPIPEYREAEAIDIPAEWLN